MKTKALYNTLIATIMAIACTTISSCTNDDTLSLDETQDIEFSEKENHYLENLNKSNIVRAEEAINEILRESKTTRGTKDLKATGILYKEELGIGKNDTLLPDTLAYFFESASQGKRYIVSADNRTSQSLLAEYDTRKSEDNITEVTETVEKIIRLSLANHIRKEIVNYEAEKDSIIDEINCKLAKLASGDSSINITRGHASGHDGDDGFDGSPTIEEEILEDWHEISYIDPMIYVSWNQKSPYNNFIKDTLECGSVPTGCVATAVAQLMTKWKYPSYSPSTFWNSITSRPTIDSLNIIASNRVAWLLKTIFIGCNSTPGCDSSSSTIEYAISFLRGIGYICDNISSYNCGEISHSLENGCPVLISGYNNYNVGHMWDIDGQYKKQQTIKRYIYKYNSNGKPVLIKTQIIKRFRTMFHHNWGVNCMNGWLVSTCFNFHDTQPYLTRSTVDDNYCNNVEIITNIHPAN
jgi:hypothetical protein